MTRLILSLLDYVNETAHKGLIRPALEHDEPNKPEKEQDCQICDLDCTNTQAKLNLRLTHMSDGMFSDVAARFFPRK